MVFVFCFSHITKHTEAEYGARQKSLVFGWADPQGGGGGTPIFYAYVGSDPASTVHPQKISGISNTPKKYLKF